MAELTPQEAAVLDQISRNPFAGQQEIADTLGIARSTVAAHIVQLMKLGRILGRGYVLSQPGHIVCIGGAVLDRKHRLQGRLEMETSNPVESFHSFGGVARNVAENLALLGEQPVFISAVGDDQDGHQLLNHLRGRGVDVSQVIVAPGSKTATYGAVLSTEGDLVLGIADMAIFDILTPDALSRAQPHLASASWVLADTNLPAETLEALMHRRAGGHYRLAVEAVSTPKVRKLPAELSGIDLLFLNADEAAVVLGRPRAATAEEALDAARALRAKGTGCAQVSIGELGIAVAAEGIEKIIDAVPATVVDITGAGDSVVAGTLHGLLSGKRPDEAARIGSLMGALTIETIGTVRADLSRTALETHARARLVDV